MSRGTWGQGEKKTACLDRFPSTSAIASFDFALKLKPNLQKAWYEQGISYYAIDFYEEAIKDFRKALNLDPHDYLSLYSLGKLLLELEAYEEAIAP